MTHSILFSLIVGFALFVAGYFQSMHILPWLSWQSEACVFVALVWMVAQDLKPPLVGKKPVVEVAKAVLIPAAIAAITAVQFGVGLINFGGDALVIAIYAVFAAFSLMVGFQWGLFARQKIEICKKISPLEMLAFTLLSAAMASTMIALIQVSNVPFLFDWLLQPGSYRRPGANIGQPNHLGTLLVLGCVSLAFLCERRRVSAQAGVVYASLTLLGMAVTESRTALLSSLFVCVWWFVHRAKFKFSLSWKVVLAGCVYLLLMVAAWPYFITAVFEGGLGGTAQTQAISMATGTRLVVWPQLIQAVLVHPWFGWGLREVSEAHNAVLDGYTQGEAFTYAHNIVLEMAVGWGVPLTLLSLAGIGWWCFTRLREVNTITTWYCVAIIIPVAVHSLLEFPFAYAYFLFPTLIAAGVLEAHAKPKSFWTVPRWRVMLVLASYAGLLGWVAVEYVQVEEDFRVARFEALNVGHTPPEYERPKIRLLTQLDALLVATRTVPTPNMTAEQLKMLHDSAMRYPWTAIQNRYALALALNGNPDEAIRQLKVMRAMYGQSTYLSYRTSWEGLAREKYPELAQMKFP